LKALFVTVPGFAPDVIVTRFTTVPVAQPETVHSLAFRFIVAVEAAGVLYTPTTQIRNVLPTTLSVLAGIVTAIKFWSVVTFAATVTGVTLTVKVFVSVTAVFPSVFSMTPTWPLAFGNIALADAGTVGAVPLAMHMEPAVPAVQPGAEFVV
jgi:hypothetical protein